MNCKNHIMPFGKYKGKDLLSIAENNPKYLIWLESECELRGSLKDAVRGFTKTSTFISLLQRTTSKYETHDECDNNTTHSHFTKSKSTSYSYNCGWGCTSYNLGCDACDSTTSELESGRWYVSEDDKTRAHKRAVSGLDPWNGWDEGEDDE